jgi:site-specific recombinase XerD
MKAFKLHLSKRGYVSKSIQRAVYCASAYETWLGQSHLSLREATYNDLLNYVGHLQKTGSSKSKCNEFLRNLRLYYEYLQLPNIAYGVKIRGETHQSMPFLTAEELDKIYHHFEPRSQIKAQAQEIGLDVIRFNQLRQSRLTLWIRQHGLRQAQYMAGFRRVGNVERYRQQDTEDLRAYVLKYHPLG